MNICLVGHRGYWGQFLLRTIKATKGLTVSALVDAAEKEFVRWEGGPTVSSSLTEILQWNAANVWQQVPIDAVAIATPPETHYAIAKEAILAGKHVLVEKPMTTCSEHAAELVRLAKEKNVRLCVDHTFLFSDHVRAIKGMIRDGKVGRVLRIVSSRENLGKFQDSGVVWDLAPHDIALANYLLDASPVVEDAKFFSHLSPEVIDTAQVHMRYPGDVSYTLNISWLYPKKTRTTVVVGDEGMIEYDMLAERPLKLYDKRATKGDQRWLHSFNWISEYQGDAREPLQVLMEEFRDHYVEGRPFPSGGELGLEVVKCVEETLAFRDKK